jgi:hypothetical protein
MGFDGFDSIEILMDVERTFAITIPDADAERITTAGALCEYVVRRVPIGEPGPETRCLSAAAFYRMRRRLAERFRIDPRQIHPETPIRHIAPAETVQWDGWRDLGALLGVRLRPLQHPYWLFVTAVCSGLCSCVLSLILVARETTWGAALVIALCLGTFLFTPWLMLRVTRRKYAVHVPRGYETVGKLSSLLMYEDVERIESRKEEWWTHEVWEILRCSIAKSADIPPAQVRKDTRFYSGDLV